MNWPQERAFDRVLVLMFENQYRSYVLQNPYMRALAGRGVLVANSNGVMHPSQTNYIASIAGELCNVTSDDQPPPLPQRTIVDLIEDAGLSWRAYMQAYRPGATPWSPKFEPQDDYPYVMKHNPFSSFSRILDDPDRWAKVGTEADFFADVLNGSLPHYAWFTPDMWSDGHYTIGTQTDPAERAPALVDQLADWLRSFFAKLRFPGPDSYLPSRTLVVVTFDEADFEKGYTKALQSTYDGPNQIYSVLLGDHLEPSVEIGDGYNHYSLLHTIERNFGLGNLGKNDAGANWFRFLWGRHFAWGPSSDTGLLSAGSLAAVEHQGRLHVATVDDSGKIIVQKRDDLGWVHIGTVEGPCTGGLALGSNGFSLVVTWKDSAGSLRAGPLDAIQQKTLAENAGQHAAVADLPDGTLMVAWEGHEANKDNQRQIFSCTGDGVTWGEAVASGGRTSGGLALARQGAVLHLVYPRGEDLRWQTWNTADFNVVTVAESAYGGSWDNSTKDAWSPCSFPVAHWSSAADPATPGEPEPSGDPHRDRTPIGAAVIEGVVHVVCRTPDGDCAAWTTMSIPGLLTPSQPVSYNQNLKNPEYSNGFGTAAQAGWSPQQVVRDVRAADELVLARCGEEALALLFADEKGGVQMAWGEDLRKGAV